MEKTELKIAGICGFWVIDSSSKREDLWVEDVFFLSFSRIYLTLWVVDINRQLGFCSWVLKYTLITTGFC